MMQKSTIGLFVIAGLVIAGIIGLAIYKKTAPSAYDGLAQCLTEKGVKMYGAWWCPVCASQKEAFGNAFRFVDYIECSAPGSKSTLPHCTQAGITGFPTWVFSDSSLLSGKQTPETLAEKVSCPLPAEESTPE